ncbi:MAG: lysophospholipid acyltransferase family protein [Aureliella sp.]
MKPSMARKNSAAKVVTGIPTISAPLIGGFHKFLPPFLKGKFHSVAVNREALSDSDLQSSDAVVVYANHASWWDPMTALFMANRVFGDFSVYAPIDADALEKYKIFKKMGFYPVQRDSVRGAAEFLKTSRRILAQPSASVWMTPEGRFVDPREKDVPFMPGLGHLASRIAQSTSEAAPRVWFIGLAIEYVFWEESKPELLAWFAPPILASPGEVEGDDPKQAWDDRLRHSLRTAQADLQTASIGRDSEAFEILLGGSTGSFVVYDLWRKASGLVTGRKVDLSHSDKLSQDSDRNDL